MTVRTRTDLEALVARAGYARPDAEWRVVSCARSPIPATSDEEVEGAQGYRIRQWFDNVGDANMVNDRIMLDVHGEFSATHVDARSHYFAAGVGAEAHPVPDLSADSLPLDVRSLLPGVVGRGVLLDVASTPGSGPISLARLLEQCDKAEVEPRAGDTLYFRMGQAPLPAGSPGWYDALPGLSIECAEWLLDVKPTAVVSDLGLDPAPSEVEGVVSPWHELLLMRVGIPLIDMAALDQLVDACREEKSATFLSVIAPLALAHASGSPVNPLAIFHPDFVGRIR